MPPVSQKMDLVSAEMIKAACPETRIAGDWAKLLNKWMPEFGITSRKQAALFLAQCGHESTGFTELSENLNYSADRLLEVFPRYYKSRALANAEARKPELIANRVYNDANRSASSKLGNVKPGDGYRFRGRGIIMLTGRWNYTIHGKLLGLTAEQLADQMDSAETMVRVACAYWESKNLNRFADAGDVVGSTKIINGGTIGLTDRQRRYGNLKSFIAS